MNKVLNYVNLNNWLKIILLPLSYYIFHDISELILGIIVGGVLMSLVFDI